MRFNKYWIAPFLFFFLPMTSYGCTSKLTATLNENGDVGSVVTSNAGIGVSTSHSFSNTEIEFGFKMLLARHYVLSYSDSVIYVRVRDDEELLYEGAPTNKIFPISGYLYVEVIDWKRTEDVWVEAKCSKPS